MVTIDARGKSCPMPIVLAAKAMKTIGVGDGLLVQADDRAFPLDIEAWCEKTGHQLIALVSKKGHVEAEIRRMR
jgi:tRNA 2-thiouridine synthesizing protein A